MSIVQAILVIIIAFFAGMDGILDEFEFYQPLVIDRFSNRKFDRRNYSWWDITNDRFRMG